MNQEIQFALGCQQWIAEAPRFAEARSVRAGGVDRHCYLGPENANSAPCILGVTYAPWASVS
jgi:hypothetical protein